MHITPSNLSIPASLSRLLPLGQFASDSNLFCTPQHKQPCPTMHFCEQPSPLRTFTSSQLPPSLFPQQPQPQTRSLPLLYVRGKRGPGSSWSQETAGCGWGGGTTIATSLPFSPPAGQIPAGHTSGVPKGLCGCLGTSQVSDSHSVCLGRAGPDRRLGGSSGCKEPESWNTVIWLVAS